MNKKFSTLVASLLLTSAFSVYSVDAKPMLATPTQVETRATLPAEVEDAVEAPAGMTLPATVSGVNNRVLDGFTNNSLLVAVNKGASGLVMGMGSQDYFVMSTYDDTYADYYYWTLQSDGRLVNNAGQTFSINADKDYFEVIPLLDNGKATQYFVLAQREDNGDLQYVADLSGSSATGSFYLNSSLQNAIVFASVETEYTNAISGKDANDVLGDGFNLLISSLKDADATITNAEAFAGDLTAMKDKDNAAGSSDNIFYIKNGNKFVVFDKDAETTTDGYSRIGKFVLVDWDKVASYGDDAKFQIKKADNGSEAVKVLNGEWQKGRLYIANVNNTYGLTEASIDNSDIPAVNWAATSLGDNNLVDLREFLTGDFYTVDFVKSVDSPADANDDYKKGGRLAIRENGTTVYADYVDAASLYEKAPEAQWAVSASYNATTKQHYFDASEGITLTNRENPAVSVKITTLRRAKDGSGLVVVNGSSVNPATNAGLDENDVIRITAVANHDKHDGYEVFTDNDLKNETYYLGQIRQAEGEDINVYWAENHDASHQIGATVDSLKATRWNLSLVKKEVTDHTNEIDSVLVVSELQEWNATKNRIDVKQDTLVILPYAFQNRSNSEFAEFNAGTNLEYYQCNVYGKDETKVYKYGVDAMFALKRKADIDGNRVYNYVMLDPRVTEAAATDDVKAWGYKGKDNATVIEYSKDNKVGEKDYNTYATVKVYQENSTDRGTWKNMQMYAGDANALMFVNKVYAPEYRKLVADAALDTITLYRGDNEHQVVYEKRNDKAVVDGRTLSFLNVDNDVQFSDINPALCADSAYVNRGNNTRWQYLLGVNIEHHEGYYCPDHGFRPTDDCEHSVWVSYNTGRYLMNMIDTANVYGQTAGIHNNPYINETEEGNQCAKLSFVNAIHVLADGVDPEMADKLYVINGTEEGDTVAVNLGNDALNTVKFAFKYTDSMESDEFKIQTLYKDYDPANAGDDSKLNVTENGYLRWVNGCIVVDNGYEKGDVFNMNEDETRTPTANEAIEAEATVSVVATDGAVIVKGAEGKNVIVSTILGKVVANETVNSDNETIAAPAGIVVVSVDGESFKVAVK